VLPNNDVKNATASIRNPDCAERNPGTAEKLQSPSRVSRRSTRATKNKRKEAERRQTHTECPHAYGARGAPRRGRLAPPFRFGRARLPAFHHGTCGGDRTPPLSSSSRASRDGATEERALPAPCRPGAAGFYPRGPVVVPAGRFGPEPPGSGVTARPREPHPPRRPLVTRPTSFQGRDETLKMLWGEKCQTRDGARPAM
jgi:hypothetical protein